jgi:hypothetical protein
MQLESSLKGLDGTMYMIHKTTKDAASSQHS